MKYTVINKNTKESKTSKYSSFKLGVGSYEFKYESNGKRIVKQFIVSDTIAPKIEFAGIPTDLYIQMIERPDRANLPSLKITDLSEINEDCNIEKSKYGNYIISFTYILGIYNYSNISELFDSNRLYLVLIVLTIFSKYVKVIKNITTFRFKISLTNEILNLFTEFFINM